MEQLNDRKSKKKCRPESKQEDIECTGNRMLRAVSTERRGPDIHERKTMLPLVLGTGGIITCY